MALPRGFNITELKNVTVADPVCQTNGTNWTARYTTEQDLHIGVKTPDTSPGIVYGLNQTQLLAIKAAIYDSGDEKHDIQLWRTPQNDGYNFKKGWLDCESSDPAHPNLPYYSSEAVAKTELREENGKDTCYVTLRLRKNPMSEMPTHIQRKSNKGDKLKIKQLDVQELYLVTLFRDQDEDGKGAPIAQWTWAFKHAWFVDENGNPKFEPRPGFIDPCVRQFPLKGNYRLDGPIVASEQYDHFVVLDDDRKEHKPIEDDTGKTDEWEACDL